MWSFWRGRMVKRARDLLRTLAGYKAGSFHAPARV
jgi:hypothetical protein